MVGIVLLLNASVIIVVNTGLVKYSYVADTLVVFFCYWTFRVDESASLVSQSCFKCSSLI